MPNQPTRFLDTDTPDGRTRKLTTEFEQLQQQLSAMSKELADVKGAKRPVMWRDKDGSIQLSGLGSRDGVLRRDRDGKVSASQQLRVREWTNYGGETIEVGWAAAYDAAIWYNRIGTMLFCHFSISGTSDNIGASFTMPYNFRSTWAQQPVLAMDNGVWDASPGVMFGFEGTNVVNVWRSQINPFTNAGEKQVHGAFSYRLRV